jgi:hypothetical protein
MLDYQKFVTEGKECRSEQCIIKTNSMTNDKIKPFSVQTKNKPLIKVGRDGFRKTQFQKYKKNVYKSSPLKKYANYTESTFNIKPHRKDHSTYEMVSHKHKKSVSKKSKQMAKKQVVQTYDDRNQQETLVANDRRSLYKNLFDAWKRSKYPTSKLDSLNKDSFFMQNANCKFYSTSCLYSHRL